MSKALLTAIMTIQGDVNTLYTMVSEAYRVDYTYYATSNNRDGLDGAVKILTKKARDMAIGAAISEGYKAGNLVQGYLGGQSGSFKNQSEEIRAKFNNAIESACNAFNDSLIASRQFDNPVPKSDDEKAKAKAEKAEKAEKAINDLITAKIQSGELVRAIDVKPFPQEDLDSLKLQLETLQAKYDNLVILHETLQASMVKPAKTKKPVLV